MVGHLQVKIGKNAQVLPHSVVTPDTSIAEDAVLFPMSDAVAAKGTSSPASLAAAVNNEIASRELGGFQTLFGQV